MIGIYFSGTGNSKYALDVFLQQCDNDSAIFSIEDEKLIEQIDKHGYFSEIWCLDIL